ncbi:MAG: hypothetical protein H6R10_1376 [Rhodocyclaceae bacterium]|nr:hypothetical protein [Rhodocyclaceae bacterium]
MVRLGQLFSAGHYDEVAVAAQDITLRYPAYGIGYKLLGSALQAQGKSSDAIAPLQEAVRLLPEDAQAWSNLGNALAQAGFVDAAVQAHETAICLQPDNATPRYNLGCIYLDRQLKPLALEQFWLAYERAPSDRALAQLCRELLLEMGDKALQLAFCRFNAAHLPDDGAALGMLGALLVEGGDSAEAESYLRRAVSVAPDGPAAWTNLCVVLQNRAALAEAIYAGRQAVAVAPDWALAHNNLGSALRSAGAWSEAKSAFMRAQEIDPEYAEAYYNLGCICADLGDYAGAREAYLEAVSRVSRPDWLLQAAHACRQVADWQGAELAENALHTFLADPGELERHHEYLPSPFAFLATPGAASQEQLRIARHFSTQFSGRPPMEGGGQSLSQSPVRLRIGLLSADFRDHATAHLMVGALEALDRERFDLVAYDYSPVQEDVYRQRLRSAIPEWVPIAPLSDLEAAQRMAEDGIHIAIDLKGWTQGYRGAILAHRPAPVQMQWLGFPGTMGAEWIDYVIADPVVIPEGCEGNFSEKVLRLPHCYQPNDRHRAIGVVPSRATLGLPEDAFVLAALHQPYKITQDTFDLWLRLLAHIPDAVLWLLEATPMAMENLAGAAARANVSPSRLYWAPRVSPAEHLARLSVADLALDVFPVNAHTTASDALWAGVPQVALCGEAFVSRVSASIVQAAGFPELVATDWKGYEALILGLARQRERLTALRHALGTRRSTCPLFDSRAFARDLGRALEAAWERRQQGLPPVHLSFSALP